MAENLGENVISADIDNINVGENYVVENKPQISDEEYKKRVLQKAEEILSSKPETTPSVIEISDKDKTKFEDSIAYHLTIDNFEGPMDLLLYLIKEAKVEIEDVNLSEITEHYISYMKDIPSLDMEKAADFIEIASTLLEIKSRRIIPQEQNGDMDLDLQERTLIWKIKEYKLFKEASEKLKAVEDVNKLYKTPDEKVNDFRVILKQMNLESLVNAFSNLLSRVSLAESKEEEKFIEKERFTVEDKLFEIRTLMMSNPEMKFSEMVEGDFSRGEIITLFMAFLELLKLQEIWFEQTEQFGEITIRRGEKFNEQFS